MGPLAFLAAVLAPASAAPPQGVAAPEDSAWVVLSPELAEPRVPAIFRGRGWRRLWADSLRLPLIGAEEIGGGLSTAAAESLPLGGVVAWGSDALAYRLVPVDRNPIAGSLPQTLRGTSLERALRDLAAATHPTGPLLAAALYRSTGLDALAPCLAVLRPEAGMAEPLRTLAGRAVWIERAPERDGQPWGRFPGVIATDSLLRLLRSDPTVRLVLPRFLAARLLDLVLGDPDGSPARWLWGLDPSGPNGPRWAPIATRQEAALTHADGWARLVLAQYQPGYELLSPGMPDVASLTVRGSDLDRPLLARLDRSTWDSVAAVLAAALTDDAIAAAVARLPPAHLEASGAFLRRVLAARRDALPRIAAALYRLVASYPDIELSDRAEQATVRRRSGGDLELTVRAGGVETLHRVFAARETEELRLHLEGGADSVRLRGVQASGVGVRITSSGGTVSLRREGPSTRRVVLYAPPGRARLQPDRAVRLVPGSRGRWHRWRGPGLPPAHPDWGTRLSPLARFGLDQDRGLLVGLGLQWLRYGFAEPDYRQRFRAEVDFASAYSGFAAAASFERRNVRRNLHLSAGVVASAIEVVRYFGYGNATSDTAGHDFYRARGRELALRAALAVSSHPELEFRLGPVLSLGSTDTAGTGTLVAVERPYGCGPFNAAGLEAGFRYAPARARYQSGFGAELHARVSGYPAWLDVSRGAFAIVGGETRLTWVPQPAGRVMVATRLGGSVTTGTVPFRLAPRVGGLSNLRGYQTDRFVGDRGAAYAALELRFRALRFQMDFLTADLGFLVFGDAGRVWSRGESGSPLHTGEGGGVWIAPALGWIPELDALMLRVELARSPEGTILTLGTGFAF